MKTIPDVKAMTDEDLLDEFTEHANWHEYVTTDDTAEFSQAYLAALRAEILARMKAR